MEVEQTEGLFSPEKQSTIDLQEQEMTSKDCKKTEDSDCNTDREVGKGGKLETSNSEGKSNVLNAGASSTDSECSLKETEEAKEPESSHNHSLNGYGLESDSIETDDHTKIADKNEDKDIDEQSDSIGDDKKLPSAMPKASSGVFVSPSGSNTGSSNETMLESVDTDSGIVEQSGESPSRSREGSPTSHGHGSHRSPDRETRAEYRKIKEEVTGEGETSESDDDNDADMPGLIDVAPEGKEDTSKDSDSNELQKDIGVTDEGEKNEAANEWVDVLGNGLLKKRVGWTSRRKLYHII